MVGLYYASFLSKGQKFRDEIRPRNGLLRAREFQMLDLYTFDQTIEESIMKYDQISEVFCSIFRDMGVNVFVAQADSGAIGGSKSHEYHIVCKGGEDTVLSCKKCGYTANIEQAKSKIVALPISIDESDTSKIEHTTLSMMEKCGIDPNNVEVKFTKPDEYFNTATLILPRGRMINYLHVEKLQNTLSIDSASANSNLIFIDSSLVHEISTFGNIESTNIHVAQIVESKEGDLCLNCDSMLQSDKCIEIGHTFLLSDKYSRQLECRTKDKNYYEMGCHGIGTTRLLGAIAELNDDGIIWPEAIVPFKCLVIGVKGFENTIEYIYKEAQMIFGIGIFILVLMMMSR